jgi:16S rRNA (guanine527-N7)-methyltransferase
MCLSFTTLGLRDRVAACHAVSLSGRDSERGVRWVVRWSRCASRSVRTWRSPHKRSPDRAEFTPHLGASAPDPRGRSSLLKGTCVANDPGVDVAVELDPWQGDPRLVRFFGAAWTQVAAFHALLVDEGVDRGLVGPREVPRLWERHLLNSAAVVRFLPASGRIVDLGSGAGLPGIVVAAMCPDAEVVLLERMARRTDWLREVAGSLGLANVVVTRARAEDVHGSLFCAAVTARAVAPLERLYSWALPLLEKGGVLVALKGARAQDEVVAAARVGLRLGGGAAELVSASTIDGAEVTTVVRVVREVAQHVR